MGLMRGLEKRGNVWRVRVGVPADLRPQWGKREEIISLNTTDENEAITLAAPVIAGIKRRIAALRNPTSAVASEKPPATARLTIPQTFDAIRAWRHATIEHDYLAAFNGMGSGRHPMAGSATRYALQHNSTIGQIADFDSRLAAVLGIPVDHPVIQRANVREWFRDAWSDVEAFQDRFSRDDFNGWPEEIEAPAVTPTPPTPVATAGMKLSELRDAWDAFKPLESKQKGYIRRLIEYLGDVDIATVTPIQMDRFMAELKRLPLSKRPTDNRLTFGEFIAKYEGSDQARLSERTLYVWTTVYKAMFEYAVTRRLLTHNPASKMMAKPTQDEPPRTEYSEADLDFLFARPMFKGFDGPDHFGYRDKAGSKVVRDAKYWLPILAIHSGMRLDEMATLKVEELIEQDGILAFDLRGRPLTGRSRVKNVPSKRLVPLHPRLIAMGFVQWARASRDPDGFIFPGLKFDKRDKRGSQFSKWWGLWCGANAKEEGQGIADPLLTFHSFRHTFKRAARETVDRDIHDILTGHTDGSVSAGYGRGVSLSVLHAAMEKIAIKGP